VKMQRQTPLVAVAAAVALVAGCSQSNVYQAPDPPAVTVSKPLQQDVTVYLEETGTTEPFQYVDVRARVKGFLIRSASPSCLRSWSWSY
jgi:multidrug efflux pump subunit AcrA (membrane-fusion protein)